jgi:hypothetical protein
MARTSWTTSTATPGRSVRRMLLEAGKRETTSHVGRFINGLVHCIGVMACVPIPNLPWFGPPCMAGCLLLVARSTMVNSPVWAAISRISLDCGSRNLGFCPFRGSSCTKKRLHVHQQRCRLHPKASWKPITRSWSLPSKDAHACARQPGIHTADLLQTGGNDDRLDRLDTWWRFHWPGKLEQRPGIGDQKPQPYSRHERSFRRPMHRYPGS